MSIKTLAGAILFAATVSAHAAHHKAAQVRISQVWSRAMPPVSEVGAVYLNLTNTGKHDDRLVTVSAPEAAQRVETHGHSMKNGMMRMRKVNGFALPAGATLVLQPGGDHLMLMGLKKPLVKGQSFKLRLEFQRAKPVEIAVEIREDIPMANNGVIEKHGGHSGHTQSP